MTRSSLSGRQLRRSWRVAEDGVIAADSKRGV
jgi:hypothetical protein